MTHRLLIGYNYFMKTSGSKINWPLIGNEHIFEFLIKSLEKKKIAGSYIFSGPADLGKAKAAQFFAQSLVCQAAGKAKPCGQCEACQEAEKGLHSDIYLIEKPVDKKNISIEQVRDFIRSLGMSSFLNSYKIGIVKGAESLSLGAVNALLKTLEEPKIKVVIILTAADLDSLPKTIVSRSQILRFHQVPGGVIYDDLIKSRGASRSQAKNFSRLSAGRPALALKFFHDFDFFENYNKQARAFFEFLSPNINQRLAAIADSLGRAPSGQESAAAAFRLITVWQNLARDFMLLQLGLDDLIQHEAQADDLRMLKNKFSLKALLNLQAVLRQSKDYIGANVNPRLALESAAVSF